MHPLKNLLALLLCLLALARDSSAAGFQTDSIDLGEERIRAVRIADLGGDGTRDIVAFADGPAGPSVHVVLGTGVPDGLQKPDASVNLSEVGLKAVYYLCLARLRPGEGFEVVVVDDWQGVVALSLISREEGGSRLWSFSPPRPVAPAPPIPFRPENGRMHVLDTAADLDGDGMDEILLPCSEGYRILRPGERSSQTVTTGLGHRLQSESHRFLSLIWTLPRLTVADWDGDRLPDLIAGHEGKLLLFLQKEDGTFFKAASPLKILKTAPDPQTRDAFTLGDVDGDHRIDLILTRSPTSISLFEKHESRQYFFRNPRILSTATAGGLHRPPDWFNKTTGISVNPTLTDFDGDGDLDLVVTSVGLDVKARIRGEVTASYLLFRFDEDQEVFEKEPYFRVNRLFPISQLERNSTAPVCFFTGDFDGDGLRDLLDIADEGHVTMLKGTKDVPFLSSDLYVFKEVLFREKLSPANDVRIQDLNADGVSDVVVYEGGRLTVIRSVR